MPEDPKALTKRGLLWFLSGMGLLSLGVTLIVSFPCKGWCSTPLGTVGTAIAFSGILPLFYGRWQVGRAARKEVEGPPAARLPPALLGVWASDPSVRWMPNPYRAERVARERLLRRIALGAVLLFVGANLSIVAVGAGLLGDSQLAVDAVVGFWFPSMFFMIFALVFSKRESFLSPLRVGISPRGVHAEYDPTTAKRRKEIPWIAEFIPWDQVGGLNVFTGWGPPHVIQFLRKAGGRWSLTQVTPAIVSAIQSAWDEGAQRPLPVGQGALAPASAVPTKDGGVMGASRTPATEEGWVPNDLSQYYRRARRVGFVFLAVLDLTLGGFLGSVLDSTTLHLKALQPWEFGILVGLILLAASRAFSSRIGAERMMAYSTPLRVRPDGAGIVAEMKGLDATKGDVRTISIGWSEVVAIDRRRWEVAVLRYSRGAAPLAVGRPQAAGWKPGASVLILAGAAANSVEACWKAWKTDQTGEG